MKNKLARVALLCTAMLLSGCTSNASSTANAATETTSKVNTENKNETKENKMSEKNTPIVYMTTDITSEGLMAVYEKLNFNAEGKVAVKLSTGEPPASNYLSPDLIKELVQSVDGTIVECNTAYGGSRASTAQKLQISGR